VGEYIDNNIYNNFNSNYSSSNYSSVLRNSVQSTEVELDIKDGMTEDEVRKIVEAVLKAEFQKNIDDNKRKALEHKINRFFVKAMRGAECGYQKKMLFRWFTCTESDEAIEAGIDSNKMFNRFFTMVRYHCPDFQYIVIEHRQGDGWRRNWHVLSYGTDKLPLDIMDAWWKANFKSMITGMEVIKSMKKAVKYVAGYLAEPEKYVRSFHSQGWVFPGWIDFSKKYNKEYETWPDQGSLVKMALMSDVERKAVMKFILSGEVVKLGWEYHGIYKVVIGIGILIKMAKLVRSKQVFEAEYLINTGNMSSEYAE
jgi:hypothetical protein